MDFFSGKKVGGKEGAKVPSVSTSLRTAHAFASDNAVVAVFTLVFHPSLKEIIIARECEIAYFVLIEKGENKRRWSLERESYLHNSNIQHYKDRRLDSSGTAL